MSSVIHDVAGKSASVRTPWTSVLVRDIELTDILEADRNTMQWALKLFRVPGIFIKSLSMFASFCEKNYIIRAVVSGEFKSVQGSAWVHGAMYGGGRTKKCCLTYLLSSSWCVLAREQRGRCMPRGHRKLSTPEHQYASQSPKLRAKIPP